MLEHFKCFSAKNLDYYNITVHLLMCNKLNESKMHGATIKIAYKLLDTTDQKWSAEHKQGMPKITICFPENT